MNKKNYVLLVLSVLAFLTISSSFAYFVMEIIAYFPLFCFTVELLYFL